MNKSAQSMKECGTIGKTFWNIELGEAWLIETQVIRREHEALISPLSETSKAFSAAPQQYPLTTGCVVYVGLQNSPCICLPQYDQCAQNTCCLKAKFRSHKVSASGYKFFAIKRLLV